MAAAPLILVSNDDGVHAPGINALARAIAGTVGEVVVVAPDRERSATAHAITLDRPLRIDEVDDRVYAVTGTPCDAVYVALHHLLPRRPDLVVSGVNRGYNLGEDVFYSGTVAAAVEGALRGIPAVAVSLGPPSPAPPLSGSPGRSEEPAPDRVADGAGAAPPPGAFRQDGGFDYGTAARFAAALSAQVLAHGLPPRTLLNVNVPPGETRGYQITRFGRRNYRDVVIGRADPRGKRYFWIGGPEVGYEDIPGSDCNAVRAALISVTPMSLDVTAYPFTRSLVGWQVAGFTATASEAPGLVTARGDDPATAPATGNGAVSRD